MILLLLTLAILATAGAQVLFRLYHVKGHRWALAGTVGLFCLVPPLNYLSLRHWSLGTVYMATALTNVLVLALAKFVLGESIGPRKIQAMALIVCGVVLFNL